MDRREEIARKYVPCRCDEIYTSRGLSAPDCPFHSTDPELAMDEYWTERGLLLLEFVFHETTGKAMNENGEIEFKYKGEWVTRQQLFESFL